VPEPAWDVDSAESESGRDSVHFVAAVGDGSDAYFVATGNDGRGAAGCLDDMLASLASSYGVFPCGAGLNQTSSVMSTIPMAWSLGRG